MLLLRVCHRVWSTVLLSLTLLMTLLYTSHGFSQEALTHARFFGDSLTDSGNNYWSVVDGRHAHERGAPITNWPSYHKQGDPKGMVWPNYIIKNYFRSNLPLHIYNDVKTTGTRYSFVNYAYAGAETGNNYLDDLSTAPYPPYMSPQKCSEPGYNYYDKYGCTPGVIKQVELYLHTEGANNNTLYFIWGGGNDILNDIAKISGYFHKEAPQ